jgi:membrane protein YdbS with pleckstrin-like domain
MGAMLMATSLVAVVQLISAAIVWAVAVHINHTGLTPGVVSTIVSLSGGAMLANIISVLLLMIETAMMRH